MDNRSSTPAGRRIVSPLVLTRRQALRLGVIGTAGGLFLLSGCAKEGRVSMTSPSWDSDGNPNTDVDDPPVGDELQQPPEIVSRDGVLTASLTAAAGTATINGSQVASTSLYNGVYPSETWRVRPGDVFRVDLTNELETFTNLHWHGLHVTPNGNSDNVFLRVDPGDTLAYEVALPDDHHSGAYWFHPHFHTTVDQQVYGGLGGMILIDGGWLDLPGIQAATEKVMVLKEVVVSNGGIQPESGGVTSNELWTINGQVNPQISVAPGERQLWRVGNLGNDSFFRLALDGHDMQIVAIDGVGVPTIQTVSEFTLPPAGRVEFLVEPNEAGTFAFKTLEVNEGFESFGERTLATMVVAGEAVTGLPDVPAEINPTLVDLRDAEPDVYRQLVFDSDSLVTAEGDFESTGTWVICDLSFDGARVDVRAKLGDLEEWQLINNDTEDHPFHIHQNDFQVTAINGVAQDFVGHRDTFTIPRGGSITIRQRYTDFIGKWVFHCHILFHEDHGMMGTIEVR